MVQIFFQSASRTGTKWYYIPGAMTAMINLLTIHYYNYTLICKQYNDGNINRLKGVTAGDFFSVLFFDR